VSTTIGVERLTDFTNWLITNNRKAFLGEFAVANSSIGNASNQIGDEAIQNMLDYMVANSEVWTGFTWWAGGPQWGDYMFTIEPTNIGTGSQADRPSMTLLQPYFAGDSAEYSARTAQWLSSGAAVPEPSTWALLVLGIACGGWSLRRRQSGH
jgi:aryl-phospho-beta-D-glucosidase BglC (GH1 family)